MISTKLTGPRLETQRHGSLRSGATTLGAPPHVGRSRSDAHTHPMQQALAEAAVRCLGQRLCSWRPVAGGYTTALRLIVLCADGTSVFVKRSHRRPHGNMVAHRVSPLLAGASAVRPHHARLGRRRLVAVRGAGGSQRCRVAATLDDRPYHAGPRHLAGRWPTHRPQPGYHLEGGPFPDTVLRGHPDWAAAISGYFAARAGLPVEQASTQIRAIQRAQLEVALAWVVRALGLPLLEVG